MKTKEEILQKHIGEIEVPYNECVTVYFPSLLDAMQEYADQFQPSEVMPSDSILTDLEQYVTNILYAAYDEGKKNVKSSEFDGWLELQIKGIDGYFKSQLKPAEKTFQI